MAKGKRRRGRRAPTHRNGTKQPSTHKRSSNAIDSYARPLRLEELEDRRLLATFNVVNTGDLQPDGDGGLEVVAGSLRDAIIRANEFPDADDIFFTGFVFDGPSTIALQNNFEDEFGEIEITGPLTIHGRGAQKLTIDAAAGSRIFNIGDEDEGASMQVEISGVTLTGGTAAGMDDENQGGAIRNEDNLILTNVEISGSTAGFGGSGSGSGGAIFHDVGVLVVDSSLIAGNTSNGSGGGIQIGSEAGQEDDVPVVTIVNSTITGNRALGASGGEDPSGYGGGVFNLAGTVTIEQSTIIKNSANVSGGGVASQGFDAEFEDDDMGGDPVPGVEEGSALTIIRSSIIVGNRLGSDPDDLMADLDDVANVGMTEGDPNADPPTDPEPLESQIASEGFNVLGVLTNINGTINPDFGPMGNRILIGTHPNDSDGVDPLTLFLGSPDPDDDMNPERAVPELGYFGGDTQTFMPDLNKQGAVNNIIDLGDPDNVEGFSDQRGRHFTRVAGPGMMPRMDVGAVEVQNGVFIVDTLVDETDGEFSVGDFSLREAILFSEVNPLRDTITFSFSLFDPFADPNPFTPAPTILMSLGEFAITKGVDIIGPTLPLEIDANFGSRIFNINDGSPFTDIDVSIRNLTMRNGGSVIRGGAINSTENITLEHNYFLDNTSSLNGGALFIQGTVDPFAPGPTVAGGNALVDSNTFFNNSAANNGGGIYVDSTALDVDIINSTLSANQSSNRGAGLTNLGPDTSVEYSTITLNNSASTRGSGITNLGDGVTTVHSTIVSGNVNFDIETFGGPTTNIVSDDFNIVGTGNAVASFSGGGDIVDDDPKLAPLLFNGGLTPTHRVLDDSPALDAGDPTAVAGAGGVPFFEQRGGPLFDRVFDGDVSGSAVIDIGAYELQEVVYTVDSTVDENDGNLTMGNFSLREAVDVANASEGALPESIVFNLPPGATINLTPQGPPPFSLTDINISSALNIFGTGVTIDGAALDNVLGTHPMFTIDDGDDQSMFDVTIDGFLLANGADRAIVNQENLTVSNIFATNNSNGALENDGGNLTINTSIITGNDTPGSGGGVISTDGNLYISGDISSYNYTLISGNNTQNALGHGGGVSFIDNTPDGRTLQISQAIIAGNIAPAGNTDGAGVFISGNQALSPTSVTQATISQSVISGNTTTGSNSEGTGLFAKDADVELLGVTVSLNRSYGTNASGAGIFLSGGSLTIDNFDSGGGYPTNSLISQNRTYGNYAPGGGIANVGGDLTINGLTISRNSTSGINSHGAGIYNSGGNVTINSSTLSENEVNHSGAKGGGLYTDTNLTGSQTAQIINSTLSGNTSPFRGGGAYNADGLLQIHHSTIVDNSVTYYGNGGGVASVGNPATTRTEVRSSIIAGNHATGDLVNPFTDVDFVGGTSTNSFLSQGFNVIGKGLALGAFVNTGDQTNVSDPFAVGNEWLAPLARDFGPTSYHALLPSSPAIGAGDPTAVAGVGDTPEFDQRGDGFTRVIGTIDVGSFESGLAPLVLGPPEDIDEDGMVTGLDFLLIQIGLGTPNATKADGDTNNDQLVNSVDIANWDSGYGTVSSNAALGASSTPALAAAILAPEPEEAALASMSSPAVASAAFTQSASGPSSANPGGEGNVLIASLNYITPKVLWSEPFSSGVREAVIEQFGRALEALPRQDASLYVPRFESLSDDLIDLFAEEETDQQYLEEDMVFEELGEAVV